MGGLERGGHTTVGELLCGERKVGRRRCSSTSLGTVPSGKELRKKEEDEFLRSRARTLYF